MRPTLSRILGTTLALSLGILPAFASSIRVMDDSNLAKQADGIARATVLSSRTAYREGPIPFFTVIELAPSEVLKGPVEESLILSLPGGKLGSREIVVAGTPQFQAGEEVLVFWVQLPNGERTLLGFSQGKYELFEDLETGVTRSRRTLGGSHLVAGSKPNQSQRQALRQALELETRSYQDHRDQILGYLGEEK